MRHGAGWNYSNPEVAMDSPMDITGSYDVESIVEPFLELGDLPSALNTQPEENIFHSFATIFICTAPHSNAFLLEKMASWAIAYGSSDSFAYTIHVLATLNCEITHFLLGGILVQVWWLFYGLQRLQHFPLVSTLLFTGFFTLEFSRNPSLDTICLEV